MGNLNSRIAGLSPEKRALLERQLLQKRAAAPVQASIQPRADLANLPLSFSQQRLWFLSQLEPDNPFYNISAALRLCGSLDLTALQASFNTVIQRHEILRATFTTRQGEPVQIVAPTLALNLDPIDLQSLSSEEQQREVNRLAAAEVSTPVDLSGSALIRAALLRLAPAEHVLLLTMHHIISDGWSLANFTREMSMLYRAFSNGQPDPLPPLAIQYFDYAQWQQDWLKGDVLQKQLQFWKTQLHNTPTVLELPTDRPRPPFQTYTGSRVQFHLPAQLYAGLQAFCRQQGVTLFMLLLAAYQVLLYRYSGQDDLCVGTPAANRNHAEIEPLIGFFVNTLVLRADLSGNPAFVDFLQQVRERVLEAQNHADLPFDMLVEALQIPRDNAVSPLFQTMFNLVDAVTDPLRLPGIQAELLPVYTPAAKFDLVLTMEEAPGSLSGTIEYKTDLFNHDTVERMAGHYLTLLEGILAAPAQPVSRLPLLTPVERQQMQVEWNRTGRPYPDTSCIHQLVESQVRAAPDAPALSFQGQVLSYAEMNRRANRLARWLREQGIGPEDLVGVYLERSFEMIIAILGVLKAGAAYLPMDPNYPAERLNFMLSDSGSKLLLTSTTLRARLPEIEIPQFCLDSDWPRIEAFSGANLDGAASPDNLAYVIYTSGSTGKPKGTLLQHRSAVNFITAYARMMNVHPGSRMLQFFSCGFDGSVAEIFSTLISGGCLYLITQEMVLSGAGLAQHIQANQITNALLPPSMVAVLPEQDLDCLQWLGSGGEKVPVELAARWTPGRHFFNVYGPTETTVAPLCYEVPSDQQLPAVLPIGRPLANIKAYILDAFQQPVPVGVPGELHIGGICLARGYLNRPELTAEKFIPDPFSAEPGARMYRTGDRCLFTPEGNVVYLGRIDRQVKLRGFRIELGEIESALLLHPAVKQAAVMLREDSDEPGGRYLAAYLIARQSPQPSQADLRTFLKASLPEYMVPSVFVFLDSFPLTSHSKIDWKALPVPERTQTDLGEEYIAPRTPLEQYLAQKWMEVIAIDRVGVNDNYFELGGNSIQAAVIINRIQEETGEPLQVRSLFLAPTVAGLASEIEQHHPALAGRLNQPSNGVVIEKHDAIPVAPRTGAELPLSYAQARLWFLDKLEPDSPFYNISTAVRLSGELDASVLEASLNEIIRRHETLRTRFISRDGVGSQVIEPELSLPLEQVDLTGLDENRRPEEINRRIAAESQHVFDLTHLPLMSMLLLKLSGREHIVILTMHHIISDGWSMGVFIQELASLYTALRQQQPSPLPELKIQYYDYAAWQRDWLQSETMRAQLAFWTRYLEGIPSQLELPTDRPHPAMQTYAGCMYEFPLPSQATRQLIEMGQRQGATGFMTLLAAFQTLMARYSGQEDICVGTPVANRTRHEVEPLIGFFVNTLVLRGDLSGDPSFAGLLERVRDSASQAFANQDVPFELLVDRMHPERNLSQSPLFQVMFSFENDQLAGFELPGLSMSLLPVDTGTSKFDITLNIVQTGSTFTCQIEYNTALFDPATIQRMGAHFARLIETAAADPRLPISRIDLLSAEERCQAIYGWNQTRAGFILDQPVHRLFEAQVRRTPDALAVSFKGQTLTYAGLNRRANQLAGLLAALGAGPETVIGLSVERSLEMIIGLLGILKSGAAYLPLDPVYPADRLAFMLEDTGASIVLTQHHLADRLPAGRRLILLDRSEELDAYNGDDHPSAVTAENAAYIIYTSGSTGVPKGVVVTHRNVANHNQGAARAFELTPADRVLQFATINFDTAVEEIFPTLLSGAALILRPEQELSTGEQLMKLIREESLTVLDFPTAYWHEWVRQLSDRPEPLPPSLRLVVVGGEKALPERYEQWRQIAGDRVTWLNTYGPTEGTIIATLYRPPLGQPLPEGRLPIGRPVDNDRIYLLDAHQQPVPVGQPGELYIAGEGVARGYLNRPDLTAERFLPDPFVSGSRMYRTGDLARYLPDGNIEYMGRTDHQVKVRGFRVEPGEIESALRTHPAVEDALVLAREDTPGVRRLVAYVVARQGQNPDNLRGYLKERLPEYMIPAAFVALDVLPLTPSGKVDRKALPAPDLSRPELDSRFAPPETPNELILAEIWSQVLGLRQVGIHDNFFDLGGDSILSIQVIARANAAGLRLSPRHLFEAQTIAQLAVLAGDASQKTADQGPVSGPAALTPIQRWFFDQDLPEPSHFNQSILLETPAGLDPNALQTALDALMEHHDMLRARFQHDENGWQQTVQPAGETASLEIVDLSAMETTQAKTEIEHRCARLQAALDITRGPLLRAASFNLGPERPGRLFLTVHHLVIDGVSWRILLEDLQTAYLQAAGGSAVTLPGKTSAYAAWAAGLEQYAQSAHALDELPAWMAEPGIDTLPLPVDFLIDNPSEATAVTLSQTFTAEETAALLNSIPAAYHTEPHEELLASLGLALRSWTGRQAFLIELEGHGREEVLPEIDLTRTVGWFTTIFPFRLNLVARNDPADVLLQVKEHLRRIPNHGFGFSLLRYLNPDPQIRQMLAGLPQGDISFNYLGRVSSDMESGAIFRMAAEPAGAEHSPLTPLPHRLTISGLVYNNCLKVDWMFSTQQYQPASIRSLMDEFEAAVRFLIARCGTGNADSSSPSDFSDAGLSQEDLEKLMDELGEAF